jgi:hypothetical protein
LPAQIWRVFEGPECDESVAAADPDGESDPDGEYYFLRNLQTLRDALALDPYRYSHPFLAERDELRICQTRDQAAGYRLIAAITVCCTAKTVELRWVLQEPPTSELDVATRWGVR